MVQQFCNELKELGLNPVQDGDFISLSFQIDVCSPKEVSELFNKYIGFWKSIAIKTYHDPNGTANYKIPLNFITGKDITNLQLLDVADKIAAKIYVPNIPQSTDITTPIIGYACYKNDYEMALQLDALNNANCTIIFADDISNSTKRPSLEKALNYASKGDKFIIYDYDCILKTFNQFINAIRSLKKKEIDIICITNPIDSQLVYTLAEQNSSAMEEYTRKNKENFNRIIRNRGNDTTGETDPGQIPDPSAK